MNIYLINKDERIENIFIKICDNNIQYNLKIIRELDENKINNYLFPLVSEFYFININILSEELLLNIKNKKIKVSLDKITLLSDIEQDFYNTIYFNNKNIESDILYKKILEKMEMKNFLLNKGTILKLNKNYNDENLNKIIEYNPQYNNNKIIAIGSSIGGINIVEKIISELKMDIDYPPIVITQHILSTFAESFVKRMSNLNEKFKIKLINEKTILENNTIYFSNGKNHMLVKKYNMDFYVENSKKEINVNKHIPSINVLFRSVANNFGKNAIGIILTGMGNDAVTGMGELYLSGSYTMAQDKKTSIIHGMAGMAIKEGYIIEELCIEKIVDRINNKVK